MSETRLEPCPFCGGKARHWSSWKNKTTGMDYNEYINCEGCNVQMGEALGRASLNVVKQWNTRRKL